MRGDNLLSTKINIIKVIMIILCILNILLIFANSALTAEKSSGNSSNITELLNKLIKKICKDFELTDHIIRKAAHFIEFSILGFLLTLTLYFYVSKLNTNIFIVLFIGLLTAVTDEFIQLFVEGRSGQVSDIVLDFSGVVFGAMFIVVLKGIIKRLPKKSF